MVQRYDEKMSKITEQRLIFTRKGCIVSVAYYVIAVIARLFIYRRFSQ